MKREDYTFEELVNGSEDQKKPENEQMQLDLSGGSSDEGEGSLVQEFPPIHYRRLKDYG